MRLGIVAVYLVTPGNERLLDLHLEYVERTTSVPYTIFAAAPRLEPGLRERLAAAPRVTIVEMPASELRGPEEHACYLERLVAAALADGVSHVVTLHVDSFPIRRGWDTETAARLDDRCPFAAVVRDDEVDRKPCTAFIFAESAFLAAHRPTFLLPEATLESAEFTRYARRFRALRDSGIGYGFAAWRAGLRWYALARSNRGEDHCHFGSVYDDLVFHLGAASWARKDFPGSDRLRVGWRLQRLAAGAARAALPAAAARLVKGAAAWMLPPLVSEPRYAANEREYLTVRDRLFADPEGYLAFLRSGGS